MPTIITPKDLDQYVFSGTRDGIGKTRTQSQVDSGAKASEGKTTTFVFEYDNVPLSKVFDNGEKPVIITQRQKFNKESFDSIPNKVNIKYGEKGERIISTTQALDELASKVKTGECTPEEKARLDAIIAEYNKNK